VVPDTAKLGTAYTFGLLAKGRGGTQLGPAVKVTVEHAVSQPVQGNADPPPGGTLYSWGDNPSGELGNGTNGNQQDAPQPITLASGVTPTAVTAGWDDGLAIGSDGNLYAWGGNSQGDLGDGTTTEHDSPEVITLAPGVTPTAISAVNINEGASMAIGSNGKLYAWGYEGDDSLGDGNGGSGSVLSPEVITLAPGVTPTAISAGGPINLAIGSDGKLYSWGYAYVGDGTSNQVLSPEVITLAPGVTPKSIAAGYYDALVIGSDNKLYSWGDDQQVGDGTGGTQLSPEAITLAPSVNPTKIAVGYGASYAIGSDDKLYAWGGGAGLGDGTGGTQLSPEAITLAPSVTPTAISASEEDAFAIGSDGNLYGWGSNSQGILGDGTTTDHLSPELITLASGVTPTAIAAGTGFSFAIGSSGPPPYAPETPFVIVLPAIAATTFAGFWVISRRRRHRVV